MNGIGCRSVVERCVQLINREAHPNREIACLHKTSTNATPRGCSQIHEEREQVQREVESWRLNFDFKYIICITDADSHGTNEAVAAALTLCSNHDDVALDDYKNAIMMSCRSEPWNTIFRSERPDNAKVHVSAKELAEAIAHVHCKDLIHGEVKLNDLV